MTCVCFLIVCVSLLYTLDQTESNSNYETFKEDSGELQLFLNSITVENQEESLAERIAPYWKLTYDKQLEVKQNSCSAIVSMIVKSSLKNLMTYKLYKIVPSPVIKAYRNKDVFQIGVGIDGNLRTVGCLVGSLKVGRMFSIHPTKVPTIKESHKKVAQVYEDFIRLSTLGAFLEDFNGGYWYTLLVRSNEAGDVMASVSGVSKGFSFTEYHKENIALKEYFLKHLPNITLFHQLCPNKYCLRRLSRYDLLYGKRFIVETLNGYMFKISPDIHFPTNILATERMYETIIRKAKLTTNTTVFDLCSGSVMSAIMLSKYVHRTVVFDTLRPSVSEARYYAMFNNIKNVRFMLGGIPNNLNLALKGLSVPSDVVAIFTYIFLLQGRDGIEAIRRSLQISRLVYVAYNPQDEYAVQNFIYLCSDDNSTAPPFRLTKVLPIDLLPQTRNVKFVLLFEREPIGDI